jgi:hypothetical protein
MTLDYENKTLSMIIVIDETGREAELFFSGMGEFRLNNAIVFNGDPSLWVTDFGLEKKYADDLYSDFYFFISNLNAFLNFKVQKAELKGYP